MSAHKPHRRIYARRTGRHGWCPVGLFTATSVEPSRAVLKALGWKVKDVAVDEWGDPEPLRMQPLTEREAADLVLPRRYWR